jgi:protein disulfide-isomerase
VKLHKEVFSQPEFAQWAAAHTVLMVADFPHHSKLPDATAKQNHGLAERYGIEGFPTIVVVSAEGKELGRIGYVEGGAKAWLAALTQQAPPLRDER